MRKITSIITLLALVGCMLQEEPVQKTPNVLFILADDMRHTTIHALGNEQIITPALDKLVKEGLTFSNCYIQGGSSAAICMPSRAMLLTGRNWFSIPEQGARIPKEQTLMGEHLQNNNYNCFGTGKWHNGKESFNRCFNHGDAIFFGGMADHWNTPLFHYDSTGIYKDSRKEIKHPGRGKVTTIKRGEYCLSGVHSSEVFADAVIDFISDYSSEKSFFAYTSFTAPHDPRVSPQKYLDMYDTSKIKLPPNFMEEYRFDYGGTQIRGEKLVAYPRQEGEIKEHLRDYYAIITHMDEQIGRIIDALKESGRYDNTLIIFSSDNGIALGSHAMMAKQDQYEHGIHIPLIFVGPGFAKNASHEAKVQLTDFFPTLCDFLKIDIPQSVQGKSFNNAFADPSFSGHQVLYSGYKSFQRAIVKDNYKLIKYMVNGVETTELYDIVKDPYEVDDISAHNSELVASLTQKLFEKKTEAKDTLMNFNTGL